MRLSYSQAWQLKEKTKERIYGLPKNYYKLLPWICQWLLQTNPRTIMEVTHSYDDHFEKLFAKHMTVGKEVIIISSRHLPFYEVSLMYLELKIMPTAITI